MSLVRIPGIIAATVGFHLAYTPPAGMSNEQERMEPTFLEKYLMNSPARAVRKTAAWYAALAECAVIIVNWIPQHPITQDILRVALFQHGDPQRLVASPMFLAGVALVVGGAYLRLRCYKALGTLFTFEMSIRSGHRLVTSGPYSVVRHPSYTGLIPTYLGLGLCHYDHNSWLRQSSVLDTRMGQVFVGFLAILPAFPLVLLLLRMSKEDAALKKKFGKEWEEWARRVPYALIPGVY
ncbi:hypothetical protein BD779DRAFT_1670030 [Infundibulicybe gibba]|nr:hypothetical protein BD779DRAFT_1670030 [Infundibulicybe gibba]